jgi:Fe-S-cluster containining protein
MTPQIELLPTIQAADQLPIAAGSFSEWLADTQQASPADMPCGSCNACCRSSYFIHIRPDDIAALDHIDQELLFPAPGLPEGHFIMGFNQQGACPMLVDDQCSIYAYRPQTCRDYDCRIFAATEIAAGGVDKQDVNTQAVRWQFDYPDQTDELDHQAVQAAVTFLQDHAEHFAGDVLPSNPTQIALLALNIPHLFHTSKSALSDAEKVAAIADQITNSH